MTATLVIFWGFAALAVGAALLCITRKNPVASALWLVVTLFSIAALFVVLDAQFIAVLQLLVYAGAMARAAAEQGMVPPIARPLFSVYLVPFEITSILLLAALVGAVVLAKRKL